MHHRLPAVNTAGCTFSLVGGLSGESWRIQGAGIDWLARPNSRVQALSGGCRRREFAVLRRMNACGLAPRPVCLDAHWLLVNWTAGPVATEADFLRVLSDGSLAGKLRQLHGCRRYGYPLDLRAQLARYWQRVDRRRLSPAWLALHRHFQRAPLPACLHLAPLHLDIHAGNLVSDAQDMMLIDWEYAADGDIALELAALVAGNRLGPAQRHRLFCDYARPGQGYTPAQLARFCAQWLPWVEYLMVMWYEVRWRLTRQPALLQAAAPLRRAFGLSQ
ncbi:phosphotransferase [Affinibrenneria salicis]|uniref:Thiamine kinase n=1 Tax=Affinibrenneria salicis TaxID=2590031 RepID=A0A5J5G415_9GAMM|nr:phosphotransferase [Affinibrenneria salicis]